MANHGSAVEWTEEPRNFALKLYTLVTLILLILLVLIVLKFLVVLFIPSVYYTNAICSQYARMVCNPEY